MCPNTFWGRSPTTRPIWRPRSSSAASWPNATCCAWRGREEFGGGGASVWEQTVVREEMWAHHEPRGAQYMGVNWVGPIIMRHGTEEQQRRHLPPIARRRGDLVPGLLRARGRFGPGVAAHARPAAEDGRRLAGQRSEDLDLLRDHGAVVLPAGPHLPRATKKQQGLTIFLVPMDDPAITVRPIGCMMGPHHLNEVFFDDLRVTEADVLGSVDAGLVDRAGRDGLRTGRHRPVRAVRTAARRGADGARRALGRRCPTSCAAAGSGCSPTAGGPA